ncbi:MAG: alcohol dehydrogenase catalytic domain-containing protein [Trebonia sp.]|uniref:zinc-dependent alcohol dehydrogenase n=1 Tax=Trebonia sp. TaxID=2767075 RepID=UPI003BB1F03B
MRAAILDHSPYQLRVVDGWPEPAAGAGQVIVQVRGVGICGSDLALLAGRRKPPALPWVPGHETFGVIVATGQDIDPGRVGERVVIEPNVPCFECPACAAGRTSACPRRQILGFNAPGTLAERVVVPAGLAWPVPRTWTDQDAVCAEPLAVAQAAIRRSGASAGMRCLVVGAGSQGMLLCLALAAMGAVPFVLEPHPGRLEVAASLGARPASAQDDGFQLAFETSGLAAAFAEAVRRTAGGGGIVAIGMSSEPLGLTSQTLVSRQLTVLGSLIYDHPGDFAMTMRADLDGLRPGRVLRACYPLDDAPSAFAAAREVPGKTWIRVGGDGTSGSLQKLWAAIQLTIRLVIRVRSAV